MFSRPQPVSAVRLISRKSIGYFWLLFSPCPGVPKLECARLGLWICGHRDDDHHDSPCRSRHAWCLELAVADDRCCPGPIMAVDLALFSSNALKIPSGGWFPLVIGLAVFTIMTTWRAGRRLVLSRLA